MANSAKIDNATAVALFFYTASNGQILAFPTIENFDSIEGAQAALEAANIQGGKPQALLAYPALAGAIAATTTSGKNFPENVEEKLQTLSESLVSDDALVAAWEKLQEDHITNQTTELADVPTERADLIAQIISNNPEDFVSTEVAEAGEMTVTFVAETDATTEVEPETTTEEVVETTEEVTSEEEANAEVTDPETGIIAETPVQTDALAHYEVPEGGVIVSESNVNQFLGTLANASETNLVNAQTVKLIAETQASAQRTIEMLTTQVVKSTEKVTVEAEVVTTPAEA